MKRRVRGHAPDPAPLAAGGMAAGHPVDVATGVMFSSSDDLQIPGRMELLFQRHYSTAMLPWPAMAFGPGWRHSFEMNVLVRPDAVFVSTPVGQTIRFDVRLDQAVEGRIALNPGAFSELLLQDGHLVLRQWNPDEHDMRDHVFEPAGGPGHLRLAGFSDSCGQGIDLSYDAANRLQQARQRREGRSLKFIYDDAQTRIVRAVFAARDGTPMAEVNYGYDEFGRLVETCDAVGAIQRFHYDGAHRIVREVTRSGGVFRFIYDAEGRCVLAEGSNGFDRKSLRYLDQVHATEVQDSHGDVHLFRYNGAGQVVETVSPLGSVCRFEFDELGRPVAKIDALGHATRYTYDDLGNRNAIIDALGRATRFSYNAQRQLSLFQDTAGGRWTLDYDERGNLREAVDSMGRAWRCHANALGDVTAVIDAMGRRARYEYDAEGNVILAQEWDASITRYQYNGAGWIAARMEADGAVTEYQYDPACRPVYVKWPDGRYTLYEYTAIGELAAITDRDGARQSFIHGSCGRLLERVDAAGRVVRYRWDTEPSRLLGVVNESGEEALYEYDGDGRLVAEVDFAGVRRQRLYGPGPLCVASIDGNGQTTRYVHDALNRLVEKQLPSGDVVRFEYDLLGNIHAAENGCARVEFERDATGRVVCEIQGGIAVTSEYDAVGNRIRRGIEGEIVDFEYDSAGHLTGVGFGANTPKISIRRDAGGRETDRQFGRRVRVSTHCDLVGRLLEQTAAYVGTASDSGRTADGAIYPVTPAPIAPAPLCRLHYEYDDAGRLTALDDSVYPRASFRYDRSGWLVWAQTGNTTEHFAYDASGNVTAVAARGPGPDALPGRELRSHAQGSRLVQAGGLHCDYDGDGRPVTMTESGPAGVARVWQLEWNGEGWLEAMTQPDGTRWQYQYDAFGRRTAKKGPGCDVRFVWDGDLVASVADSRDPRHEHWVFGPDDFTPLAKKVGAEVYMVLCDHQGMPRRLIAADGSIAWSAQFSAWGRTTAQQHSQTSCNVRFPGQWLDEESGLFYNRFRYYDPRWGRYLTPDPVGLFADINPYRYCPAPTAWTDPFGLDTVTSNVGGRDYTFQRDSQGRTVRAEGPLCNPNRIQNEHRDTSAQRNVSAGTGDHAGHLIGNQFGGPGGQENLTRMCPTLNLSGWKKMENQLKTLTRANSVRVVVTVHYDGNSTVPSRFTVDAHITDRKGNVTQKRWIHKNCT
jgi:RHS repeat-associated protein